MSASLSPDRLDYLRRLVTSAVSLTWHVHPSDCVTYADLAALIAIAEYAGTPHVFTAPEMTWAECRARAVRVLQDNDWQHVAAHDEWPAAADDLLEAIFEPLPWEAHDEVLARAGRPLGGPAAVVDLANDRPGRLTVVDRWAIVRLDGEAHSRIERTHDDALATAAELDRKYPSLAPHRVARVALVDAIMTDAGASDE